MDLTFSLGGIFDNARIGLKSILSYLNMPSLSGVRLETYQYEETLESKISSQMLINFDNGKSVVNDNIAPMPRTWTIGAYIGSATIGWDLNLNPPGGNNLFNANGNSGRIGFLNFGFNVLGINGIPIPGLEPSIFFMPSLKQQKDILTNAWLNNKLVWFVDKYKSFIPVGIQKLTFISDPTVQNKIPVSIVLKEIITYNQYTGPAGSYDFGKNGSSIYNTFKPDTQNPATSYVSMGNTASTNVGLGSSIL